MYQFINNVWYDFVQFIWSFYGEFIEQKYVEISILRILWPNSDIIVIIIW